MTWSEHSVLPLAINHAKDLLFAMPTRSVNSTNKTRRDCRCCDRPMAAKGDGCPTCKCSRNKPSETIALGLIVALLAALVSLLITDADQFWTSHFEDELYTEGVESLALREVPKGKNPTSNMAGQLLPLPAPLTLPSAGGKGEVGPRLVLPTEPRSPKTAATAIYEGTPFQQGEDNFRFYVAEKKWNAARKRYDFYRVGMPGAEIPLRGDARRHFISENQADYPEPESGCGPTALLNLYIWYSKFGLLDESIRHADSQRYKELKFEQIDRRILDIQKESRTKRGGTNTLASIVAIDALVQEYGRRPTRLHFEIKKPPLSAKDFVELSRNYRAGILSVRPRHPATGELMSQHAVLCIRGDSSGMITLANWGEFVHGRLANRDDGQWFIPRNGSRKELKIKNLTTLIPFTPEERQELETGADLYLLRQSGQVPE